jgi:hypothetical protein
VNPISVGGPKTSADQLEGQVFSYGLHKSQEALSIDLGLVNRDITFRLLVGQ